jgi:integrase
MSRPVKVDFPYTHRDKDRRGNVRIYYRRRPGAPKIRIDAPEGSPEFAEAYAAAKAASETKVPAPAIARQATGTLGWLVSQYVASAEFKRLDAKTARARRACLMAAIAERINANAAERFAAFPLPRLTPKAIRVLRDRKVDLPEGANNRLKAIKRLLAWGVENDHLAANVARDVPKIATGSTGHHTWTPDEVVQFEQRHSVGSMARLALALLLYTGVRRSDAVLLGRQHARDGWLRFPQFKNRRRKPVIIEIPILPALQAVIDATKTGDLAYLSTGYGQPFRSGASFGNWFRDRCDEAALSHCSAHGLRKAGATVAAENGATAHQRMAIFGWLTVAEAERYTQAAQRKKMAGEAMPLMVRRTQKAGSKTEQLSPPSRAHLSPPSAKR